MDTAMCAIVQMDQSTNERQVDMQVPLLPKNTVCLHPYLAYTLSLIGNARARIAHTATIAAAAAATAAAMHTSTRPSSSWPTPSISNEWPDMQPHACMHRCTHARTLMPTVRTAGQLVSATVAAKDE